jgi:hypothetical protein
MENESNSFLYQGIQSEKLRDALTLLTDHLNHLVCSFGFAKESGVLDQKLLFLQEAIE